MEDNPPDINTRPSSVSTINCGNRAKADRARSDKPRARFCFTRRRHPQIGTTGRLRFLVTWQSSCQIWIHGLDPSLPDEENDPLLFYSKSSDNTRQKSKDALSTRKLLKLDVQSNEVNAIEKPVGVNHTQTEMTWHLTPPACLNEGADHSKSLWCKT